MDSSIVYPLTTIVASDFSQSRLWAFTVTLRTGGQVLGTKIVYQIDGHTNNLLSAEHFAHKDVIVSEWY